MWNKLILSAALLAAVGCHSHERERTTMRGERYDHRDRDVTADHRLDRDERGHGDSWGQGVSWGGQAMPGRDDSGGRATAYSESSQADTYAWPRSDDRRRDQGMADWGADSRFIHEAAEGGMMEVELGRLAVDRAENQRVREFGQRMVDDHSHADDELKQVVRDKGGQPPDTLSRMHRGEVTRLGNLSGVRFDREYMRMMVDDHNQDVAAFEREASRGKDTAARDFASRTLPTLREHQRMAKEISADVGAAR